MSDLLNRLIARATRPASAVEPILASRYEPRVALDQSRQLESNQPRTAVPAESRQPPEPPAIAAEPHHIAVREEEDLSTDFVRSSPPLIRPMEFGLVTARADGVPTAKDIESPIPASVIEDERLTPWEVDALGEGKGRTQRTERSSADLAELRSEPIRTRRVSVAPQIVADQPNRTGERAERVADLSDPVEVHVTIGHVEVRAAPLAKGPVRRTALPPPTRLSLADYLKRRNGGPR